MIRTPASRVLSTLPRRGLVTAGGSPSGRPTDGPQTKSNGQPPSNNTPWIIGLTVAAAAGVYWYSNRETLGRREEDVKRRAKELEAASKAKAEGVKRDAEAKVSETKNTLNATYDAAKSRASAGAAHAQSNLEQGKQKMADGYSSLKEGVQERVADARVSKDNLRKETHEKLDDVKRESSSWWGWWSSKEKK